MLTLYCILDPSSDTDPIQCEQCSGKLNQTDPLNSRLYIRSRMLHQAIRGGTYHIWNRSIPCHNHHKNRAGSVGSSVNRRAIRYGFRGAPIIDPVQCEHGLMGSSLCEHRLPFVELFLTVENL